MKKILLLLVLLFALSTSIMAGYRTICIGVADGQYLYFDDTLGNSYMLIINPYDYSIIMGMYNNIYTMNSRQVAVINKLLALYYKTGDKCHELNWPTK
jgi:hypothetical protein